MHLAHVPQSIYLADSTIEENIAFGIQKEKINHEQVKKAAEQAEKEFTEVFSNKGLPEDIELKQLKGQKHNIIDLIAETGLSPSKSETRRIIQGGGVRVDGEKLESIEEEIDISKERLIQVGKRRFVKVVEK